MVDKELLKACVLNPWSVVPRMMLIDSMIESGFEEFKAMEAFEPPPLSNNLPSTYNVNIGSGFGGGRGPGGGYGRGIGIGGGIGIGIGGGSIVGYGRSRGISHGIGSGSSYDDNCGFLMIAKQQWLTKNY